MKNKIIFLLIIYISVSVVSLKTYRMETSNRILKADLMELSDIKYGMFNIDVWEEKIAGIISKKVEELEISEKNKEENRTKINTLLEKIINNFEINYRKENQENSLFGISIINFGASVFSVFEKLKNHIPNITNDILNFLEKKENKDKIKDYIIFKIDNYKEQTFQKFDYTEYNRILHKYNSKSQHQCISIIENQKNEIEYNISILNYLMGFLLLLCFLIILMIKQKSNLDLVLYSLIALNFLILGISLPMIDIEARIKVIEFKLLGENISFINQVLYFKSKSVLEMAKLMLTQNEIKIILVGLLVLIFSVVFPLIKIISTILILYSKKIKSNRFINFMVFKSGKWSMADVMVVAIFMSYIGFSGIISNQLSELENITNKINILTTNNSSLQNGFFFFAGFVIFGIFISQMVQDKLEFKSRFKS